MLEKVGHFLGYICILFFAFLVGFAIKMYLAQKDVTPSARHGTQNETVIVTFNPNNGNDESQLIVVKGSMITKPSNPTKKGYIFLGWYEENKKFDFNTSINTNLTLIAKYESIFVIPEPGSKDQILSSSKYGDVNGDGVITLIDAELILKHIYGDKTLSGTNKTYADIDLDGYLTYNDYLKIKERDVTLGKKENQVEHMIPGDYKLDGNINQEDVEEFKKFLNNNKRENAPYLIKGMDLNGDGKVDFNDLTSLEVLASYNLNLLSGATWLRMKNDSNFNLDDSYVIERTTANVNGLSFNIYYVFNIKKSYMNLANIKKFAKKCLEFLAKVDYEILNFVKKHGTDVVILGSYDCDPTNLKDGKYSYAAYCDSYNRDLVIGYENARLDREYYHKSIVHECGHAYDYALMSDLGGPSVKGFSEITAQEILDGFKNSKNQQVNPSRFKKLFYNNYDWKTLAENDAENLKRNLPGFSGYSLNVLQTKVYEYFADIFQNYYLARNSLKAIAPNSYYAFEATLQAS